MSERMTIHDEGGRDDKLVEIAFEPIDRREFRRSGVTKRAELSGRGITRHWRLEYLLAPGKASNSVSSQRKTNGKSMRTNISTNKSILYLEVN